MVDSVALRRIGNFNQQHEAQPAAANNTCPGAPRQLLGLPIFDASARLGQAEGHRPHRTCAWWQTLVARPSRRALAANVGRANPFAPDWQRAVSAFDQHVAAISKTEAAMWLARQTLDFVHVPRRVASWLLFPGQLLPIAPAYFYDDHVTGITRQFQCLITKDHAVLEGVMYACPAERKQLGSIVVVPGNAMRAADGDEFLRSLSDKTGRNVFLFNTRNFGRSVGSLCTPDAAVSDVRAIVSHVVASHEGPCSVLGISMGGGVGAAAVRELLQHNKLQFGDVDAVVAVHSFRSLPAAVAGLFGTFFGTLIGTIARFLLWCLRFNPLDTEKTLSNFDLAPKLVTATASADRVISPSAALKVENLPRRARASHHTVSKRDILRVGRDHCDLCAVPSAVAQALRLPAAP